MTAPSAKYRMATRRLKRALENLSAAIDDPYTPFPSDPEKEIINSSISVARYLGLLLEDICEDPIEGMNLLSLSILSIELGNIKLAESLFWRSFSDRQKELSDIDIRNYHKVLDMIPDSSRDIRENIRSRLSQLTD